METQHKQGRQATARSSQPQQAVARLSRQCAEFDARLTAALCQLEQHVRKAAASVAAQADAVARLFEAAETGLGPDDAVEVGEAPARGRTSEPSLEAQLAELAGECKRLEAALGVSEAADRAKSCLLAAMSHELRTPVQGVRRMVELLDQTDLDAEQRRYLRTANYSVHALWGLLESVLNVAQVGVEDLDIRSSDFDLRRTIQDAVDRLRPVAERGGAVLRLHIGPKVPNRARGEARRVQQILLYAVGSATGLATEGTVHVRARLVLTTQTTTTIRFTIHLPGAPMEPAELDRVIASAALFAGGPLGPDETRGFGLAIARQLAELMGGHMGVDPGQGEGERLRIWFTIPLERFQHPDDDRRAHRRLPQELLQSSLGPVLDLSMIGMRVQSSQRLRGEVDLELLDLEEPINLRAEVVWIRRLGFRKFQIGLNFLNVRPEAARQLTRVSLNHRLRRLLGG